MRRLHEEFDRRRFLIGSAAVGILAAQTQAPTSPANQRVFDMNRRWLFGRKPVAGFAAPGYDDSNWEKITLPHANVRLPWHSFEEKDFQYVSAHRRHFRALPEWRGKRVFVDFQGAMTAATVTVNGHRFEEYKGGYTPFSFEITPHLNYGTDNVLAVELDSTERNDIPPFGGKIDHLTFGGVYRDVQPRVVPQAFIENVYARPLRPLENNRELRVRCYLGGPVDGAGMTAELQDGGRVLKTASTKVSRQAEYYDITLDGVGSIQLWDLKNPKLYDVVVRLTAKDNSADKYRTRVGFRERRFTSSGFLLNGQVAKLRGLNRHQTFPYVGGAMAAASSAPRHLDSSTRTTLQHRSNVALSSIATLPGRLRRTRPFGARRDPRLATYRGRCLAGHRGPQRG
jgi:beta-galactosidase